MAVTLQLTADMIPDFTGEESVRTFISHINDVKSIGNWTDEYTIQVAKIKIKGNARKFLEHNDELRAAATWRTFCDELIKRYETPLLPVEALHQFRKCKQRAGEGVKEYGERLQMLALARVKPSGDANRDRIKKETIREECLQHFMEGLNDPIRQRVMSADPPTFDDAVTLALKEEQVERHVSRKVFQRVIEIEEVASDQEDEENSARKKEKAIRKDENYTGTKPKNPINNKAVEQSFRNNNNFRYSSQQRYQPSNNNFAKQPNTQYFVNSQNQPRSNQQYSNRANYNTNIEPVCYACKRTGHFARQCNLNPRYLNDNSAQQPNNFFMPRNNYQQMFYQPINRGMRAPFNQQTQFYNRGYVDNQQYHPFRVEQNTFSGNTTSQPLNYNRTEQPGKVSVPSSQQAHRPATARRN